MSGEAAVHWTGVVAGLSVDVAWKSAVPLAAGLMLSHLPGTAAARHQRLLLAVLAVPVLTAVTLYTRGSAAALSGEWRWLPTLWLVGACVLLAGMGRSLVRLYRLPTRAFRPGIEQCDSVSSPITVGVWRPRVVVPTGFEQWPAHAQAAALTHEAAHIRRRDWLTHVLVWGLTCVFWVNPLMWWSRRRLVLLAECATDDEVLCTGVERAQYAQLLLDLSRQRPRDALALGASSTAVRIRSVVANRPRARASRARGAALAVVAFAASLGLARAAAWTPTPPTLDCAPAPQADLPDFFPSLDPGT